MTITFACSNCSRILRVADSNAGRTGRCPGCGARTDVPALEMDGLTEATIVSAADVASSPPASDGSVKAPRSVASRRTPRPAAALTSLELLKLLLQDPMGNHADLMAAAPPATLARFIIMSLCFVVASAFLLAYRYHLQPLYEAATRIAVELPLWVTVRSALAPVVASATLIVTLLIVGKIGKGQPTLRSASLCTVIGLLPIGIAASVSSFVGLGNLEIMFWVCGSAALVSTVLLCAHSQHLLGLTGNSSLAAIPIGLAVWVYLQKIAWMSWVGW